MMDLPFLKKNRIPKIASKPPEEKLVNGSASDHIDQQCIKEMMDAAHEKDTEKFKSALEALILNMFDDKEPDDAA